MTQTDSKKYAQALLGLNPYNSAQQIVEQRARYLGLDNQAPTKPGADAQLPRRRQTAEAALAEIRSDFWISPLPQIQSRLAALKLEGMPDLAASATRLAQAPKFDPEFERLYAERKVNKQFVDALRQILVLPPAAAGQRKDQQEHELCRGRKLRSAKSTVRFIDRNYPQIYQLEREWFDHIASASRFARPVKRPSGSNLALDSWFIAIVYPSFTAFTAFQMMSERGEPRWELLPHDPVGFFELAGSFDRKTLKQRYTDLIRHFKPEKHPSEFQRIRAAFESARCEVAIRPTRAAGPDGISLSLVHAMSPRQIHPRYAGTLRTPALRSSSRFNANRSNRFPWSGDWRVKSPASFTRNSSNVSPNRPMTTTHWPCLRTFASRASGQGSCTGSWRG